MGCLLDFSCLIWICLEVLKVVRRKCLAEGLSILDIAKDDLEVAVTGLFIMRIDLEPHGEVDVLANRRDLQALVNNVDFVGVLLVGLSINAVN